MVHSSPRDVIVVGAGFSLYAGLPLQKDFTAAILSRRGLARGGPSRRIVDHLTKFVRHAFGLPKRAPASRWPELEDLFTNIDLAANTGHNLGADYLPSDLRTVRRALIARIIRMLRQRYRRARKRRDKSWKKLEYLYSQIDLDHWAFICMSWDSVVEERIARTIRNLGIDYGCDSLWARFPRKVGTVETPPPKFSVGIPVIKIHGSTNWLYCDNCRTLFSFPPRETIRIARQLLGKSDWRRIIRGDRRTHRQWKCNQCDGGTLGTRLATFSYQKALEFPMFQKSWASAADLLHAAKRWVFIGYSLPPADYEFKHLLKRVQLSRQLPPEIIVITGGKGASKTASAYEHFFGKVTMFPRGISKRAVSYLAR